ncbi:transcriptional regulator [Actinoplanes sp. SE50]|uniref:response regulator transcription factor n=1 Tax=unclassified Actinoplanes TaxID=2626549 RepID=UPI00023EC8E6|nr:MULTISPECIES: response regulator [unclassified Actinoplanes]AEV82017.1 putative transcriptional regulator ycf27 [Actinoplanes sp. SE50/110]ATO80416.1 transcriptional regulator [Actinoplanes sp. SE50]SLL97823.1 putative response regulator receiver domain protein [Actinoplanes sp. SE50/110]
MNENLILIADDDADVRDLLSVSLEAAGFRAVGAKDGHTAARILTVAKPIGMITDVRMPAMNGMELCQLARSTPSVRDMAILMVSGNSHAYDVDAGMISGADGYLAKPLTPKDLVAELQNLISRRHPAA